MMKYILTTLFAVMLTATATATELNQAATNGDITKIERLLDAGADPNARNEWGATALHGGATINGHIDIIKALLDAGTDPNTRNISGYTALHITAADGQPAAINALLDAGAYINIYYYEGLTALHDAARFGKVKAITALLDAGAAGNLPNKKGEYPIDMIGQDTPALSHFLTIVERVLQDHYKAG